MSVQKGTGRLAPVEDVGYDDEGMKNSKPACHQRRSIVNHLHTVKLHLFQHKCAAFCCTCKSNRACAAHSTHLFFVSSCATCTLQRTSYSLLLTVCSFLQCIRGSDKIYICSLKYPCGPKEMMPIFSR